MNSWLREWSSRLIDADRETRSKAIVSAVTVVSNLAIGGSAFAKADGGFETAGAAILVVIGIAHSAELLSQIPAFRRSSARQTLEPERTRPRQSMANKRHQQVHKFKVTRRGLQKTIEDEQTAVLVEEVARLQVDLSRETFFFYAGAVAAALGVVLSVTGLAEGFYPATLTGSILTTLGFVTLACALIAGKEAGDRANEDDDASSQGASMVSMDG